MGALALAWLTAAASLAPAGAGAQEWPDRPVRLILPAATGGSADPLARLLSKELGDSLKGNFLIENRPGANGNIGAASVARSKPDGYTVLLSWTATLVSAVTMYGSKPFDPQRDFDPVVLIASIPNVIVVNTEQSVRSFAELTSHVRRNPGKLNYMSVGSGSSWHLSAELYKKLYGVSIVHIPYTSPGGAVGDLVGNRVQVGFPGLTAVAALVKEDRLRALAVMADKRSASLPDVPTTRELGAPQLESVTWFALLLPKGSPREVTSRLNGAVNAALANADFRSRLEGMGYSAMGGTPAEFAGYMEAEIRKWGEVVKFSGARLE